MNYNQSQLEAIKHGDGPMMVLAGPGSGKTLVITRRTQALIEQHGVNPNKILVITFTRAAANEMKERFEQIMGGTNGVTFGTFHSVFFTILRYAYGFTGNSIIREEQKRQFFQETVRKLELELEDEKEFLTGIEGEISLVKGDMMNLDHYYSMNCSEDIFKKIYHAYDEFLRTHALIDFDDMMVFTYELFCQRPDILALWQKKYQYILIDEFQDINSLQYKIVRQLASPSNNLFIVGDDDQSIYRFRGAKPEIMLNFEKDYPGAKRILLNTNYRSTKQIVEGGLKVIHNNKKRFEKTIVSHRGEGNPITLKVFDKLQQQNQQIIDQILDYRKKGASFSELAVIFRTNTQPRSLIEKMIEYNIPFKMKDSIPNIYDHWIAKNLMDYLKMARGCKERAVFYQIMNRPKRYINRECVPNQEVDFMQIKSYYTDKPWVMERINKLEYDLSMIKTMDPYSAIHYIRNVIGYNDYLKEYAAYRRLNEQELIDTIDEIQASAKEYKTYEEWIAHIEEYKEELQMQNSKRYDNSFDGVAMATMHSSKGLEYRVVFIIDANEEITPHHKAILDDDLEEERRMFYVAMTRAKDDLYIYSVKERYNKELAVSRFVNELYMNASELKVGLIIYHKTYGKGKIIAMSDGKMSVQFEKQQSPRTLNIEYCIGNQLIQIVE